MEIAAPTPPRKPIRRTPEEWEAVRRRREAGETVEALAEELGVKVATVRGRTRPRPGEPGAAKRAVRLNAAQRLRVCQLYTGGMTAQQIADEYDVCKGTVTNIVREGGCRRFDLGQRAHRRLTSAEREALLAEAPESPDAAVRALAPDAPFTEAAEAAGRTAVAHLRQARPNQCLAYLRNVSAFRRLVAEETGAAPPDDFADTPARRAALAILRAAHGLSRAGEEDGGCPDPIDRRLAAAGPSTASRSPSPSEDDGEETVVSASCELSPSPPLRGPALPQAGEDR